MLTPSPDNDKIIWPANIFATNRILKVKGRIIFLINSTKTKKGAKAVGEPKGTKWDNQLDEKKTIQ